MSAEFFGPTRIREKSSTNCSAFSELAEEWFKLPDSTLGRIPYWEEHQAKQHSD